jgi:hypothetical protein
MWWWVCFSFSKKSLESYSYFVKIGRWYFWLQLPPSIYPGFAEAVSEPKYIIYRLIKVFYSRDVRCSHVPWVDARGGKVVRHAILSRDSPHNLWPQHRKVLLVEGLLSLFVLLLTAYEYLRLENL